MRLLHSRPLRSAIDVEWIGIIGLGTIGKCLLELNRSRPHRTALPIRSILTFVVVISESASLHLSLLQPILIKIVEAVGSSRSRILLGEQRLVVGVVP
jgi:hypothetical protein